MNIVFLTNTFLPHVGGVARSVSAFAEEYRRLGHKVLIVAPEFPDMQESESDVIRVPALQKFNASDFSVALPIPTGLSDDVRAFGADIIHSHHPFLLGSTAIRLARYLQLPLVFTHHTLYEQYTHYVPGDSPQLQTFIIELATRYANLCDQVFAPSDSIQQLITERGVTTPVDVVPTGVYVERFAAGKGAKVRRAHDIPKDAFVIGHMGRLAPEKNLEFLCKCVSRVMKKHPQVYFLVVGKGSSEEAIKTHFEKARLMDRVRMLGILQAQDLSDALAAMNVFAFTSKSETQGMVLTEAMAAGLPVVALDASGAREVVRDSYNGRLLRKETVPSFAAALDRMVVMPDTDMKAMIRNARKTAKEFSMENSARKALELYARLVGDFNREKTEEDHTLDSIVALIKAEWDILASVVASGSEAISSALTAEKSEESASETGAP